MLPAFAPHSSFWGRSAAIWESSRKVREREGVPAAGVWEIGEVLISISSHAASACHVVQFPIVFFFFG